MQNLITKTSFQILSMLLCPHISNYRTEPPRAFKMHINLPHLQSENTLNIPIQMCIHCKMLIYSAFSSAPAQNYAINLLKNWPPTVR